MTLHCPLLAIIGLTLTLIALHDAYRCENGGSTIVAKEFARCEDE